MKLRDNVNVSGLKINRKFVKIAQLADDTTLFLKYTDVPIALKIVEEFGQVSGLILNKEKTEGMYLGRNKKKGQELCKYKMGGSS